MRKFRAVFTYVFLLMMFSVPFWGASFTRTMGTTAWSYADRDSVLSVRIDSVKSTKDTLALDSLKRRSPLEDIVNYTANDSIVMTANNWGYLYGNSEVKYTELELKAEHISFNMDSSLAKASYATDTTGIEYGYPIFTDGGTEYEAKTMNYNLKTKKMFVNGVITQQGEGYVTAGVAKKTEDNAFFMQGGRYTTCDDPDCPHFYFALTKAKIRPQKDVITGPAYLVIEELPIPFIGIPFGFFPFSDSYSSGVIMPTLGDEMERGFFLRDGGYYFAISDNIDLALTGEIYTKGSWGINARSSYRKRYKYAGNFDFGYLVTKFGDKEIPDEYAVAKDMRINWTHSQDPKANMFRTLSASVNFSTSSYNRNQLNSVYNPSSYTQNTKGSSVNLTQRFPDSPWSLSATMNVDQRSRDSTISLTLPNMSVSMNRISPFKRKHAVGSEKWYEKIQLSYRGEFRNSITTKENELFKSSWQKDWQKAMRHAVPISATFTAFEHFNITPSINYNERWYFDKVKQKWNGRSHIDADTILTFSRVYDFNTQVSVQTTLYGFYKPLFDKKSTVRHVFSPSIGLSYTPDFSNASFGFYDSYDYYDADGELKTHKYSMFKNGMFGSPSAGKQGNINFSFDNNIEMVRQMTDTIKKISLVDNLGIRFSYNMMADSLKWSDINTNVRLKLSKNLTVNINAVFDPYLYDFTRDRNGEIQRDTDGNPRGLTKINKMRVSRNGSLGRLIRTGYSISPSINQDTFKKWFGGGDGQNKDKNKKQKDDQYDEYDDEYDDQQEEKVGEKGRLLGRQKSEGEYDTDGYLRNEVKWSLSASYSFNYGYNTSRIDEEKKEYKYRLTHNLGFSGSIQPTKNWSMNFTSGYDFDAKEITFLNCNISRNLHCFTLTASFIPIGPYKSYFVSISASSSMLQDLKYDKRGRTSSYDPVWN